MAVTALTPAAFLERVRSAGVPDVSERVEEAFVAARHAYGEEMHWTGVPLLQHVLEVLDALLPFRPDQDAVVACLLHHVLQVKAMTLGELEEQFGPKIRSLVGGVHLLSHVRLEDRRSSIDDLRLMLLSVSDDIRTVLITLCDRLSTLRHLQTMGAERAKRLCQEILQIYAPVAARLGVYAVKHEMERLAFPVVYPDDAARIAEQITQVHAQKGVFLPRTAEAVRAYLAQQGISATVEAREKQLYSIFVKMRNKSCTHVEDLADLFALRVIVPTTADCYQALGLLHRLGRPVSNRFKDYIAFPKPNGYQSLHTTLAQLPHAPEGTLVEVQVRTETMHREAQYGVAAHWTYKEGGSASRAAERIQLSRLLSSQHAVEEAGGTEELADHIFVLTPHGDIVELPEGATPLDFAFQVHTNLGLAFRSARVNGAIVPLDYELQNGDIVEIQKRRNPEPSPQWMHLLRMASSRSKLKRYLYAKDRPRYVAEGRTLVNAELAKHRFPPLDADLSLLRVVDGETLTLSQREDLLMKIGQGSEKAAALLPRLDLLLGNDVAWEEERGRKTKKKSTASPQRDSVIEIEGGVPMPIRYAKCCAAGEWPREDIAGVINRCGEVMVHRSKCRMLRQASADRRIRVRWRTGLEGGRR